MLGNSPLCHLRGSGCSKKEGWQYACGNGEQHPAYDLCCVVGACDVLEEEAVWNDVTLLPRGPQICQYHMAPVASITVCCSERGPNLLFQIEASEDKNQSQKHCIAGNVSDFLGVCPVLTARQVTCGGAKGL